MAKHGVSVTLKNKQIRLERKKFVDVEFVKLQKQKQHEQNKILKMFALYLHNVAKVGIEALSETAKQFPDNINQIEQAIRNQEYITFSNNE